jgi:hypothetical protein
MSRNYKYPAYLPVPYILAGGGKKKRKIYEEPKFLTRKDVLGNHKAKSDKETTGKSPII